MEQEKIEALSKHLKIDLEEAQSLIDDGDYLVLTDNEAEEMAGEYIEQSLWAFNAWFLADHAKDGVTQDVFESIQANNRCESNNEAIRALLKDFNDFIKNAIGMDGRGHFLSSYDGNEIELGNGLFAYRVN